MGFVFDASHYQGTINWPQVKADGCLACYIKTTDGTSEDPTWQTNHNGARSNGIPVGPYHFAEGTNADHEAATFASIWPAGWNLHPVLDYEIASANASWLSSFRTSFRTYTTFEPFRVYSSLSLLQGALNPSQWVDADTSIWVARYNTTLGWNHPAAVLWQNTDAARVIGIVGDVDEDQFLNGWTPGADMTNPNTVTGLSPTGDAWLEFILRALQQMWGHGYTTYPTDASGNPVVPDWRAGGDLTWFQQQLATGLAPVLTQLAAVEGSITAEQATLLSAVNAITTGEGVTDAQIATITASLEAALPTYTVTIAPKTS